MKNQLKNLQEKIGYQFRNETLLAQALTHSSYANEHRMDHNSCNERLEFLGDAVLELTSSEFLYQKYGQLPEGDLTKVRASIVCDPLWHTVPHRSPWGSICIWEKGRTQPAGETGTLWFLTPWRQ